MSRKDLRAARANPVFCTDEKRIRAENRVMDKNSNGMGVLIQDRRLRADGFIVRAQSVIRADGAPSAQVLALRLDVSCPVRTQSAILNKKRRTSRLF
jgi:hypothetical protein